MDPLNAKDNIHRVKKRAGMVQFAAYKDNLPAEIAQDVLNSKFKNLTQYSNALYGAILDGKKRLGERSYLEEAMRKLLICDAIPVELLKDLEKRYLEQL